LQFFEYLRPKVDVANKYCKTLYAAIMWGTAGFDKNCNNWETANKPKYLVASSILDNSKNQQFFCIPQLLPELEPVGNQTLSTVDGSLRKNSFCDLFPNQMFSALIQGSSVDAV
jgi:hypothetical protein